jgi:hypothetical protein
MASGFEFKHELLIKHCEDNHKADMEFCGGELSGDISTDIKYNAEPLINGQLVLVASIGQGLTDSNNGNITAKAFHGFGLSRDVIAKPKFHLKPLTALMAEHIPASYREIDAHHYAFMGPFPAFVFDAVAKDPAGFDRQAFLDEINADIVEIFTQSQ